MGSNDNGGGRDRVACSCATFAECFTVDGKKGPRVWREIGIPVRGGGGDGGRLLPLLAVRYDG